MQLSKKIREYSQTVCRQIKWKKAHTVVSEEIENHLVDQRNAYISEGEDESSATDKAITQMGDPIIIGTELDCTHHPKPQWSMLILIFALLCIGATLTMLFMGYPDGFKQSYRFLILSTVGLGIMATAYFIGFVWLNRYAKIIYLLLLISTLVAFVMCYIPSLWGQYYYMEFVSLLFPLGFAGIVYSEKDNGYKGIILCGIAFLLPSLMLFRIRFFTELILFAVSAFVMICIAISRDWFNVKKRNAYLLVFVSVFIMLSLAAIFILSDSHKLKILQEAFSLSYDPLGTDSFKTQIVSALSHSKFIGRGVMLTGSQQEPGFNIFCMLTSLIFYYGWISVIPIIGILLCFIIKGFRLCFKQTSALALFVSLSIMMTFTTQVISYVLFNLGFTIFGGLSIPFIIQFGYYEYLINFALVGLMLSVFRTGHVMKDKNIKTAHKLLSIR